MLTSNERFIYLDFDVCLQRCNRRSAQMTVKEGMVYIKAPYLMPQRQILEFIDTKQNWLCKQINAPRRKVDFEMRNGETVWILGKAYKLVLADSYRGSVTIKDDEVIISGSSLTAKSRAWRKFSEDLADRYIDHFHSLLNCNVGDYQIEYRYFKSRWGCCFKDRRLIRINLWCICLDEEAFRYVYCHELAHLKVANHQKEFYNELSRIWPDYKKGLKLSKQYQIA